MTPAVEVRERPILFSAPMVRAILAGRKTQTRRIVKPQSRIRVQENGAVLTEDGWLPCLDNPYGQVGDRLWVRETFASMQEFRPIANPHVYDNKPAWYKADCDRPMWAGDKWKPSIFMPREYSRITLEIVSVRVERIHEISEADAIAEGFDGRYMADAGGSLGNKYGITVVDQFRLVWHDINGKDSWDANPWVWVIEFKRIAQCQ